MTFIDSHSHLYSSKFSEDRAAMMARTQDAGVVLTLMPAVDTTSHAEMLKVEADYPERTLAMIGLHPVSVKEDYERELAVIEEYLKQRPWVAIGEIGMDLYWDKTFRAQQEDAFLRQCSWAIAYDLPICIHARESIDELIALIRQVDNPKLRGVFHCFTGTPEQAAEIIELGFYLGIGGIATFKNGGLEPTITSAPRDRILLETDAPYLAPVPKRGKRNETSYLPYVAHRVAELWNVSEAEVATRTAENTWQLFELDRFAQSDFPWVMRSGTVE